MAKLVYVLWKSEATEISEFTKQLFEDKLPRLLALEPRKLTLNVSDVDVGLGATVPIPNESGSVAGLVTVELGSERDREPMEELLSATSSQLAGYEVTESIPRDYDRRTWADGERTPGVKLVTLFRKPDRLSYEAFIKHWHESHTPLSLEVHPLWCYIRNVVERAVTPDAPEFHGIVEEQFRTVEDLTDPDRFYGSEENQRRVLEDAREFLDLEKIQTYTMSEYIQRS